MKNLYSFLKKNSDKKLILVFPHPDDEAYVAGGLLQLAQRLNIKTKLICLTKGGRGLMPKDVESIKKIKNIREKELIKSCSILGVDEYILWDFPDAGLLKTNKVWINKLAKEIKKEKSAIVVTFDLSGITGHPDHVVIASFILKLLKDMGDKYTLLLRSPDKQEKSFFKANKTLFLAQEPTHEISYPLSMSLKKIRAIFAHKSQLKDFFFKMQILEWFLFDHKELYHLVNYKNVYPKDTLVAG
jgi:LmbE family N-acetylglucosaminyl deacetylase